jgi:hypothetical protein
MPTSVAALMERLEEGLARRRTSEAVPAEPPQVFPQAPEAPPQPAPAPQQVLPTEPVQGFPEGPPQPAPAPQQVLPPEPVQVFPEAPPPAEDRLQRAIASLQHLAARAS